MKQFTIVFDSKQKEYATILNTLVSEEEWVKNIKVDFKEYESGMTLTDKDNVLFVGEKSSKNYIGNFKDKYSKYGIHLGFRGCKAWIYCEKFDWNEQNYKKFHDELLDLYKRLDMNPAKVQNFVDEGVKEYCKKGTTTPPLTSTFVQQILWGPVVTSLVLLLSQVRVSPLIAVNPLFAIGAKWIKSLLAESTRIDQQYRFATVLFFSDHLKAYLKEMVDGEHTDEKENEQ